MHCTLTSYCNLEHDSQRTNRFLVGKFSIYSHVCNANMTKQATKSSLDSAH
jgi:hypothetical protein